MRRRFLLLLAFLLAFTLVPARASAAVNSFKFNGASAFANFSLADPNDPCISTNAGVLVTEGRIKEGGGKPQSVSEILVGISRLNNCTFEFFLEASGIATLPPEAFVVHQLDSATLNTTVEVCDSISGNCFPVSISLSWTGTGSVIKDKSKSSTNFGKCKIQSSFNGTFRDAVATGSITGQGTNFTPNASDFAQLADVKNGTSQINCN